LTYDQMAQVINGELAKLPPAAASRGDTAKPVTPPPAKKKTG
jgi:hypothetical protein